jgi:hypothetical protein
MMQLFLIWQTKNQDYDTFSNAVVAAPDARTARRIMPNFSAANDAAPKPPVDILMSEDAARLWVSSPRDVRVMLLSTTSVFRTPRVVSASFNAG